MSTPHGTRFALLNTSRSAPPNSRRESSNHGTTGQPWNSPASGWDALSQVQSWRGSKHDTEMMWIPGVVAAFVYTSECFAKAMDDLHDALGPSGTAQGILFMPPDLRSLERPSNAALAMRRIRVVILTPQVKMGEPLTTPMREEASKYLVSLGRRAGDRFRGRSFRLLKSHT